MMMSNRHSFTQCCGSASFCADPYPNFHVYANPDPDPDWHQSDADPHADPTTSFNYVGKSDFFTFGHSITNLKCFLFLISVKYIVIFNILDSMLKYSGKN
jgi:hypothetical protein